MSGEVVNALGGVISIILMVSVGFFLSVRGWFDDKLEDFLLKLAVRFAIPLVLFCNAVDNLNFDDYFSMGPLLAAPLVSIILSMCVGFFLAWILKIEKNKRGVFIVVFAMSNTIVIGLPVCLAIFGESGTPYVVLYYLCNTVVFWTVGVMLIARDGGAKIQMGFAFFKRLFSPPVCGFLVGVVFVLIRSKTGFSLPQSVLSAVKNFANLNTPLCMLIVGYSLYRIGLKNVFKLGKPAAAGLLGRFLITPAITICVCLAIYYAFPTFYPSGMGAITLPVSVFAIESAMPVMNQCVLMSKYYNADSELATKAISASIICMLPLVPVLMFVCSAVFK